MTQIRGHATELNLIKCKCIQFGENLRSKWLQMCIRVCCAHTAQLKLGKDNMTLSSLRIVGVKQTALLGDIV